MPSQTKSQLVAENATLRARLAELEARLASRTPGKGKELPESDITERKPALRDGKRRLLGGEAMISGKPGEGTLVRVTLPVGKGAVSNA